MRKPFTLTAAVLLAASLFVALTVGPAAAEEITVPLDRRLPISDNLTVHLIQVTISDVSYGGAYSPRPEDMVWPNLVYQYENIGSYPENGHLHIIFTDDSGATYEARDAGTLQPIRPGNVSGVRLLEVAMPKDRKVTRLTVVQGFITNDYKLEYPGASTPTSTPTQPSGSPTGQPPGKPCLISLMLPPTLIGAVWLGRRMMKE